MAALTTLFKPPTSCFNEYYRSHEVGTSQYFDGLGPSPVAAECYPTLWVPQPSVFFSPGLCPLGYATVASTVVDGVVEETQAICCPR
jgi:hypothetical protein